MPTAGRPALTCNSSRSYRRFLPMPCVSTRFNDIHDSRPSKIEKLTDGPGSTGKNRPESLICSLRLIQGTEGCTTTSMLADPRQSTYVCKCIGLVSLAYSSACKAMIWSMKLKSMLMPPYGAEKLASKLEPPEYGTWRRQHQTLRRGFQIAYSSEPCICDRFWQFVRPLR